MATLYEDDGHVLSGAQCDRGGVQHTGIVGLGGERALPVKICVYFTGPGAWGAWCSSSSEEEEDRCRWSLVALRALPCPLEQTYVYLQAVFLHSVKGISCTDKNTVLSKVLEGELTVRKLVGVLWWAS